MNKKKQGNARSSGQSRVARAAGSILEERQGNKKETTTLRFPQPTEDAVPLAKAQHA